MTQSQPLMVAPILLPEAIKDLKNNIMEAQHLTVRQNRKKMVRTSL